MLSDRLRGASDQPLVPIASLFFNNVSTQVQMYRYNPITGVSLSAPAFLTGRISMADPYPVDSGQKLVFRNTVSVAPWLTACIDYLGNILWTKAYGWSAGSLRNKLVDVQDGTLLMLESVSASSVYIHRVRSSDGLELWTSPTFSPDINLSQACGLAVNADADEIYAFGGNMTRKTFKLSDGTLKSSGATPSGIDRDYIFLSDRFSGFLVQNNPPSTSPQLGWGHYTAAASRDVSVGSTVINTVTSSPAQSLVLDSDGKHFYRNADRISYEPVAPAEGRIVTHATPAGNGGAQILKTWERSPSTGEWYISWAYTTSGLKNHQRNKYSADFNTLMWSRADDTVNANETGAGAWEAMG